MKKTILTIAIGILSIYNVNAQITEVIDNSVEIGSMKLPGMPKHGTISLEDSNYFFSYKDIQFSTLTKFDGFYFQGEETLNALYAIFKDQLAAPKKTERVVNIKSVQEEATLYITTKKILGNPYLSIRVWNTGHSSYLNIEPKQLETLFGK